MEGVDEDSLGGPGGGTGCSTACWRTGSPSPTLLGLRPAAPSVVRACGEEEVSGETNHVEADTNAVAHRGERIPILGPW